MVPWCRQAESDHHVRDTLNYMTVQTDVAMPIRAIQQVQDAARVGPWRDAIRWAVAQVHAEDKDARILNLGASAGMWALQACRCGALISTPAEARLAQPPPSGACVHSAHACASTLTWKVCCRLACPGGPRGRCRACDCCGALAVPLPGIQPGASCRLANDLACGISVAADRWR